MAIFMIERNFAEKLEATPEIAAGLKQINDAANVRWLISFLSTDKKKTFCLYEAESSEAIKEAAENAGIPADSVMEVDEEVMPTGMMQPITLDRFAK